MNPPTHIVRDLHSRAVGSVVGLVNIEKKKRKKVVV
jgi:hypothetical protein